MHTKKGISNPLHSSYINLLYLVSHEDFVYLHYKVYNDAFQLKQSIKTTTSAKNHALQHRITVTSLSIKIRVFQESG